MQVYWIAALAFGIAIALFAVQNSGPVQVSFLWFRVEAVALSVLVLICAAIGALITFLFGLGREVRLRWSRRTSRRTVRVLEQRIAELEGVVHRLEQDKAELQGTVDGLRETVAAATRPAVFERPPSLEQGRVSPLPPRIEARADTTSAPSMLPPPSEGQRGPGSSPRTKAPSAGDRDPDQMADEVRDR